MIWLNLYSVKITEGEGGGLNVANEKSEKIKLKES
jgi:hypothetical protein